MANYTRVNKARSSSIRIGAPAILLTAAVYCVLVLSACSESKNSKQEEGAAAPSSSAVAKQETPALHTIEPDKSGVSTVEREREEAVFSTKAKETTFRSAAKSVQPATSETIKTKDTTPAPDTLTKQPGLRPVIKEIPPQLASKSQETTPSISKKEEVATAKEPAVVGPLSLKMNIIGQRKEADGSYTEVLVSEGSVLRSRDNFQIHLESNRPAYAYILIYDSQGKAGQIFPEAKASQAGYVEAGKRLVIPSKDLWFWLDDNTGTETIYVLASEKPMTAISGLLGRMEGADDAGQKHASQEIKQRIAIMQRGVGDILKGQSVVYRLSDGKKIQKVTDVVTGTGSVVRAVSFQHR